MIERLPRKSQKNPRALGEWFARRFSRAARVEGEDYWQEERRKRMDNLPAGPGLKEYELDMELFQYSNDMTALTSQAPPLLNTYEKVLQEHIKTYPDKPPTPLSEIPDGELFVQLMYSSMALSGPTHELREWLTNHVPQNGYFTPEMVAEAVAENPDITVEQTLKDGLLIWKFADRQGEELVLSRTSDGSRPAVPTEPYLSAHYWSDYDFDSQEVIAAPRLGISPSSMIPPSLNGVLMDSLGLTPVRIPQELVFRVVDPTPRPYFTDASHRSLESVVAEAHVIADLPH